MGHLFTGDLHNHVTPLSDQLLLFPRQLGTAQRVRSVEILRHKSMFHFSPNMKQVDGLLSRGQGDVEMKSYRGTAPQRLRLAWP
jgi:hypothetical protein